MPSSYILLVDNSETKLSKETVDLLNRTGVNFILQKYDPLKTDSIFKAQGEAFCTTLGIEHFTSLSIQFDIFFKISGRYYLNESFNLTRYLQACKEKKMIFWLNPEKTAVRTVVYAVAQSKLSKWKACMLQLTNSLSSLSLEEQLYLLIREDDVDYIDKLGFSGLGSVNKECFVG